MPARTTRSQARERAIAVFMSSLDRIIPADESTPLRGSKFLDWELQVQLLKRAVVPTILEERAALEGNAKVESGHLGHCVFCGSDRLYLIEGTTPGEVIGPDGPSVIPTQSCRCRSCGRTFSPSAP
jgi:hypothetical protein